MSKKVALISATINGLDEELCVLKEACEENNLLCAYLPWIDTAGIESVESHLAHVKELIGKTSLFFFVWTGRCGKAVPDKNVSLAEYQLQLAYEYKIPIVVIKPEKLMKGYLERDVSEDELWDKLEHILRDKSGESYVENHLSRNLYKTTAELKRLAHFSIFHALRPNIATNLRILISSTFIDLKEERKIIKSHLESLGIHTEGMETLPHAVVDAKKASSELVAKSNVYLGIFALRYGEIIEGLNRSYTHYEYEEASKKGYPSIALKATSEFPVVVPSRMESPTHRKLLGEFHSQLEEADFKDTFSNDNELEAKVIGFVERLRSPTASPLNFTEDIPASTTIPYYAHPYGLLDTSELQGRDEELALLDGWIDDYDSPLRKIKILSIHARGGTGKSALVWTWVNRNAGKFEGVIWWSFYHHNSTFSEFINHALAYLDEQLPKNNDLRKLDLVTETYQTYQSRVKRLLQILSNKRVLLIFDGLERRLSLYTQTRAIEYEHRDLDDLINDMKLRYYRLVLGKNYEHLLADNLVPQEIHLEANKYYRKLGDDEAYFLKELAEPTLQSRVVTTTRFFPSDLEENTSTNPLPYCLKEKLRPFDSIKTKRFWESFGLTWERDVEALLIEKCGGYPLYSYLLAQNLNHYGGSFASWRSDNAHELMLDNLSSEDARSLIVLSGLSGMSDKERELLSYLAINSYPTEFDELVDTFVLKDRLFEDIEELYLALCNLRKRKIAGLEPNSASYDLHPIIRHSLRSKEGAELEQRAKQFDEKLTERKFTGSSFEKILTKLTNAFGVAIRAHNIEHAIFILKKTIPGVHQDFYSSLRFHSGRFHDLHGILTQLVEEIERANISSPSDMIAEIYADLSDSWGLQGKVSKALDMAKKAEALAEENSAIKAYALLAIGDALSNQCLIWSVEKAYREALNSPNLDPNVGIWLWCKLGSIALSRCDASLADRCLSKATRMAGENNADVLTLAFKVKLREDSQEAFELAKTKLKICEADGLYLGKVASFVHLAEASILNRNFAEAETYAKHGRDLAYTSGLMTYLPNFALLLAETYRRQGRLSEARMILEPLLDEDEDLAILSTALLENAYLLQAEEADESLVRDSAVKAAKYFYSEGGQFVYLKELTEVRLLLGLADDGSEDSRFGFELPRLPFEELPELNYPVLPPSAEPYKVSASPTSGVNLSDEELAHQIELLRQQLDWENTTGSARKWWETFESENENNKGLVHRLMEELSVRKATITEFFLAYVYSLTDNIQANLFYLDYKRIKQQAEKEKKEGALIIQQQGETPRSVLLANWIEEVLKYHADKRGENLNTLREDKNLITQLKEISGWENTSAITRRWWETFESENKDNPDVILVLLLEIAARKTSLDKYFSGLAYSNTDDVQANLCYLDYTELKKQEELKKETQKNIIEKSVELGSLHNAEIDNEIEEKKSLPDYVSKIKTLQFAGMDFQFVEGSKKGSSPPINEDFIQAIAGSSFIAFLAADGMGGPDVGNVFSRVTLSVLGKELKKHSALSLTEISGAIKNVNLVAYQLGENHASLSGGGATLTGMIITKEASYIINVGNSRTYRIRNSQMEQLTTDHTLRQEVGPHSASLSGHMLTRSIGTNHTLDEDILTAEVAEGDYYLICSDGVTDCLPDEELLSLVKENTIEEAVAQVLELISARDGKDDSSLILFHVKKHVGFINRIFTNLK